MQKMWRFLRNPVRAYRNQRASQAEEVLRARVLDALPGEMVAIPAGISGERAIEILDAMHSTMSRFVLSGRAKPRRRVPWPRSYWIAV